MQLSSLSSLEPPSTSDFSEESQSILCDNVQFVVPVSSCVASGVNVSCSGSAAGGSADASLGVEAEGMDFSVSLKRKGVPSDASTT